MTEDEDKRKCSFIRSFPTRVSVCFCSQLLVCFQRCHSVYVHFLVCVCHMNAAQWLLCEVSDSFIMACAHRETAPSRGRREEDRRGTGQVYCRVGPHQSSCWWKRMGWGQLLSPLMSQGFFHQLSIYRPVQHSFTGSPNSPQTLKYTCSIQAIHWYWT